MSTPETSQPAESQPQSTKSSGSSTRLLILVVILLLAIGALVYDQKWARPQSKAAYDRIVKLSAASNARGKSLPSDGEADSGGSELRVLTNEDIQAELGKKPFKQTEEDDGRIVEHYRWMGGLPLRYYTVYVVYAKGTNGRLLLSTAHLNELPPANESTSEEFANMPEVGDVSAADGPPPIVPGGPGGPGGEGRGGPGGEGRGGRPAGEGDDAEGAAPESAESETSEPAAAPETPDASAPESENSEKPAEAPEAAAENEKNGEEQASAEPSEGQTP